MVSSARQRGLRFEWIAADGAYGKDPSLLRALDDAGETFVMDVHRDQPVYLDDPGLEVPAKTAVMGRPKSRLLAKTPKSKLCDWVQQQPDTAWRRVFIRHSTRGTFGGRGAAPPGLALERQGDLGALLACLRDAGGRQSFDGETRPQQCSRVDLRAASGADAAATLLDRARLSGREEHRRTGRNIKPVAGRPGITTWPW